MNRRELIAGAALFSGCGQAEAFGLGQAGRSFGRGGSIGYKSSSSPFVPMVPLAGAAVDIDFVSGGSYPTALSTLLNAGRTQAIGALLTLMTAAQGSLLLQLKANPAGTSWLVDDLGGQYFGKIGTTQFRAVTQPDSIVLLATMGSGTYAAPSKLFVSWGGVGTSAVANNGAVVTNASILVDGTATGVTVGTSTDFTRLTGWITKLPDATGKGFTV